VASLEPRALDYLVLVVTDLDRSVRFWRDVLGVEHQHTSGDYAQLRLGDTRLGLFVEGAMSDTLGREVRVPTMGAAGFEVGFVVDDIDDVYAQLVADGAEAVTAPADRPWGQRTAYVADPDGYLIELVRPL
jgi:catechol 2,3-dioxygenase-like lactoylglutathione lyase family enzyme